MAKFRFTAISPDGSTITGIEDAVTASLARRSLMERNLAPVEVSEKKSFLQFEITARRCRAASSCTFRASWPSS